MTVKENGRRDETGYKNVFLATSEDGVHWKDFGCVIEAPFPVWAMMVYRCEDGYILNHGSFDSDGKQNVIKLWKSADLLHWEYTGEEYDVFPDYEQCSPRSRLDCMYVLREPDGYYGIATGPQWLFRSADGLRWESLPTPKIEWGDFPPSPMEPEEGVFEVAGCEKIGGKYYLIGGWFNYMGYPGYGDYVLAADALTGPYRPVAPKYRFNGHSDRWVCLWARYLTKRDELLFSSYMVDGYSYECGTTWLPPLKKVCATAGGGIAPRWWAGNEALKGERAAFSGKEFSAVPFLQSCGRAECGGAIALQTHKQYSSLFREKTDLFGVFLKTPAPQKGMVLEGKVLLYNDSPRDIASAAGFYLPETESSGTGILIGNCGYVRIGRLFSKDGEVCFSVEDESRTGICATTTRMETGKEHAFRLLAKENMFEIYLDDGLVQTFNTAHDPQTQPLCPAGIGFLVENGKARFSDLRMWLTDI